VAQPGGGAPAAVGLGVIDDLDLGEEPAQQAQLVGPRVDPGRDVAVQLVLRETRVLVVEERLDPGRRPPLWVSGRLRRGPDHLGGEREVVGDPEPPGERLGPVPLLQQVDVLP
jgi:hypothetical protein